MIRWCCRHTSTIALVALAVLIALAAREERIHSRAIQTRNCQQIENIKAQISASVRAGDQRVDSYRGLNDQERKSAHELNAQTIRRFKPLRCPGRPKPLTPPVRNP